MSERRERRKNTNNHWRTVFRRAFTLPDNRCRELRKRYDHLEADKTCEEERRFQRGPSNFAKNLRLAMDGLLSHATSVTDVDSLLRVRGVGPKIAEIVASSIFCSFVDGDVVGAGDGAGNTDDAREHDGLELGQRESQKVYVPKLGSANYAFLVVLHREQNGYNSREYLTKKELMDLAEASGLSHKPIHSRGSGAARVYSGAQASRSYYSGWSSFKSLVSNGLVRTWGSPKKISLTEAGNALAQRLANLLGPPWNRPNIPLGASDLLAFKPSNIAEDSSSKSQVVCGQDDAPRNTHARATADDSLSDLPMDIVLLIDSREQYARSIADKMPNVEIRTLPIGDALWIARLRGGGVLSMSNSSLTPEEYVLDYVIERKSIEDLLHSVRDGNRYHSQKYRLQQCGLRHLYYLVEGDVESLSSSTDYKVVSTACAKTSAIDGFNVLRPKSFAETLVLYSRMTSSIRDRVRRMFKSADRNLDGAREWARASGLMTFAEFQARNVRLEKDANCARDIWTVMLNEVPGIGKVAVEGRIFSDPRHRTCHGFYSDACRDGRELERTANSNKVESVRSFLFF